MSRYLAAVTIAPTEEMKQHAAAETQFVGDGKARGVIAAIYATPDKKTTWHLIEANDEKVVRDYISTYPFAPWFTIESVTEVISLV